MLSGKSYLPSDDAEGLRQVVREYLDKHCTEADVRRLMETPAGYDPEVWRQAAQELGLHGLALPEIHNGSGASPVELGLVFEEMGASLYCGPFFATVGLAATALLASGYAPTQLRYLPNIADGSLLATFIWPGAGSGTHTLDAVCGPNGWEISGTADVVIDGGIADLLVIAAQTPQGLALFTVLDTERTVAREALSTMDQTRKLAALTFRGQPAELLCSGDSARATIETTLNLGSIYLAAEQLGGAARVLAASVDYARTRVQFGRAIGSFQAIKHRCADMLIDVEATRSVVYHGLWTAAHEPSSLAVAAGLARAVASDAYRQVATHNIQIHGGIGFTWEHPAHLYLKRAKSSQLLLASPAACRAELARLLDVGGRLGRPDDANPPLEALLSDDEVSASQDQEIPSIEIDPTAARIIAAVDSFLAENPVPDPTDISADRAFRIARFDAGLAMVHFAAGHGGVGADSALQSEVEQRFLTAGAADHVARNVIGLGMALPTIHEHGTEEQKARYLRTGFSGEDIWCQLFSEPGAGSDLAGLSTRAVRDGEHFVLNGQKVWTSLGHVASFGLLLARTDPEVPKHQGLTYFLLDMRAPGVDVRPLRQLTGEAEFNEVFLTDVRVPVGDVLGEIGKGWTVAMTTLANERVSLGGRLVERGTGPIHQAVQSYRAACRRGRVDAAVTERLMMLWTHTEAARLTNERAAATSSGTPGPQGSIAKLQMAELNKAVYEFCLDLSGVDALLIDTYAETAPDFAAVHGTSDVRKAYLRSLANSIEGGTSEVLRNILGERVLGLPGEPRLDRDLPWTKVRRS